MSISRRSLLGGGLGAAPMGALGAPGLAAPPKSARKGKPKNVIFCVTDGTALQVISMADDFQRVVNGRPGYWAWLVDQEYATSGLQSTRSLNSVVTDSSAASSAWGSGRRIWNGQLNQYPDGTLLRPLTSVVREAGMKTGLVTTTTITHATPSGFAVNCVQRDLEGLIAENLLKAGVDVLMGGGDRFFSPALRKDRRDLYADFAKAGYQILKSRQELMKPAARSGKVLGIFHDGHMPYSVDHLNDPASRESKPTLVEMTRAALASLKGASKGFLMQVEGGRVDAGAHGNDLAATLYDYFAFEEAVKAAVEFAHQDGETLVVITADHATGGPSLNGSGTEYIDSTAGLKTLAGMKASYGVLLKAAGNRPSADRLREVVREGLSITLTAAEAEAVAAALRGQSPFGVSEFYGGGSPALAMALGNHTKVTWTSSNHTSDHVLVTAIGPGSASFAGLTPNHRFFGLLLAAKGLRHENPPQMDFETAKKHYAKLKVTLRPELFERYACDTDGRTLAEPQEHSPFFGGAAGT